MVSGAHSIATDGNEEEMPLLQKSLGLVSRFFSFFERRRFQEFAQLFATAVT